RRGGGRGIRARGRRAAASGRRLARRPAAGHRRLRGDAPPDLERGRAERRPRLEPRAERLRRAGRRQRCPRLPPEERALGGRRRSAPDVRLATVQRLWLGAFPALVALAVVGGVLTANSNHDSHPVAMAVVLPLIGMTFVVSGLIARTLRPDNRIGLLLALAALFGSLFLGAFVHLMLAFPEGRLASRLERRLIVGLWATAFLAGAL